MFESLVPSPEELEFFLDRQQMMATLSDLNLHVPSAIWEFPHHHRQLFNKHGVRGGVKIPLARGDAHVEEEGIESNSVAWVGDCVFLLQTISNVSTELPPEPAVDLAHKLAYTN